MQTSEERLQFAITLIEQDLDGLAREDWETLRRKLMSYFDAWTGGLVPMPHLPPHPQTYPMSAMKTLQQDVARVLESVVARESSKGPAMVQVQTLHHLTRAPGLPKRFGERQVLIVSGHTRDVFLDLLFHMLAGADTSPIRRCEPCGRLFVRVRRQKFCTNEQCSRDRKAAAWESYVKTPVGRKARARQYEKRCEQHGWTAGVRKKRPRRRRQS